MSTNIAGDEARNTTLENAIRQELTQGGRLDAREGYRARLLYGNEPLDRTTTVVCVAIGLFLWPVYIYLAYRWVKAADSQVVTLSVDSKGDLHRIPPENRPTLPPGVVSPEKKKRKQIVWLMALAFFLIIVLMTL
ncbi:hypothetical protein GCM10019016_098400 [Streptomyces prasinosporus]|uniref:Uncharacterized protein n=2 Tax=Streptomyces prasinosporus TaxID=68256 RepID=A0ABP6U4W0_9ACTN